MGTFMGFVDSFIVATSSLAQAIGMHALGAWEVLKSKILLNWIISAPSNKTFWVNSNSS